MCCISITFFPAALSVRLPHRPPGAFQETPPDGRGLSPHMYSDDYIDKCFIFLGNILLRNMYQKEHRGILKRALDVSLLNTAIKQVKAVLCQRQPSIGGWGGWGVEGGFGFCRLGPQGSCLICPFCRDAPDIQAHLSDACTVLPVTGPPIEHRGRKWSHFSYVFPPRMSWDSEVSSQTCDVRIVTRPRSPARGHRHSQNAQQSRVEKPASSFAPQERIACFRR